MTDPEQTISVAAHDTLPEVLGRLRDVARQSVHLDIPASSSLFLTANEFRALRTTADQEQIALTIDTADPLRQQLAGMFRLSTSGGDTKSTAARSDPTERAADRKSPVAVETENTSARSTVSNGASASRRGRWAAMKLGTLGRGAPVTLGSPATASASPANASRNRDSGERPADISEHDERATIQSHEIRRRAVLAGAIAVAVIVVLAAAGAFLLLPRATVALYLQQEPVSGELLYSVGANGAAAFEGSELALPAEPVTIDVTVEHSIETTGVLPIPDQPAAGRVLLSNPNPEEITIPAGTTVSNDAGMDYAVTEEVTVPAGNPDEGGYGQGAARVQATAPGTGGNLGLGDLSGRLDSGVYYSNRESLIEGGTDRSVPVVSEADLQALRAAVEEALPNRAEQSYRQQLLLAAGEEIIPSSLTFDEIAYTFDHQAGEEASTVAVQAATRVSALKYDAAGALQQATKALQAKLASAASDGFELAPSTMKIDGPVQVAAEEGGVQLRMTATATAAAELSEDQRHQLARDLSGKDDQAADVILQEVPGVARFDVSYSPGWLPARMPRAAGQIDIEPRL